MSKKTRLVKTSIYIRQDQISELNGTDFTELERSLKELCSKSGNGKNCVSIVRIIPTFASTNTVDVEFAAFNEDFDFIEEDEVVNTIANLIDTYIDVDFSHITVKQITEPFLIMGDLD